MLFRSQVDQAVFGDHEIGLTAGAGDDVAAETGQHAGAQDALFVPEGGGHTDEGLAALGHGRAGEEVQLTREQTNQNLFILAALEDCVLQNYDFIPLTGDNSAALKGMQIEYFLEDEVFPLGRGGVKYMTYNYTDAEWAEFVADQGGVLNYK